jgi:type IV secretory pathway VirB3-like protein
VATVLYGFILRTLSGWRTRFASAFLVGWSVVIFVLLRSIGILFVWLGQLLLGVVYEILLAAHVITIREEQTTKEVIGYK